MRQLPTQSNDPNIRALGQAYRETFTGITGTTITLTYEPNRTVDDVGLEAVFKNGMLLDGAGGGFGSWKRETFTGITDPTFTLSKHPVVIDTALVFKNGQLLDDHPQQSVPITGLHTSLIGTVDSTVDVTSLTATTDDDHAVTGTGAGTATGTITSGTGTGIGSLVVEPARGTYDMVALTGVVTPSVPPIETDVFTVLYQYGAGTTGAAGYAIDGKTLTLADALIATDVVVITYPYRH